MTDETKKEKSIILLDDDRFLLDMYSLKFSQEGYTVQSCLAVKEVIDLLERGFDADAVVFDLVMPEQDGFDLLRQMRDKKLAQKAVWVALTNQGADEERKKTEDLGAHEYIVKATTIPSEVVNTITQAIERHHRA